MYYFVGCSLLEKALYCLLLVIESTQRQTTTITAVNIIQAAALEVDDTDGHDSVSDDSDTATDDDDEQDFCKEGEYIAPTL